MKGTDPDEELMELRSGNAIIFWLGSDGGYQLTVVLARGQRPACPDPTSVQARLNVIGGTVFIGPGEHITGGGLRAETRQPRGRVVNLAAGVYDLVVQRAQNHLILYIAASEHVPEDQLNATDVPLELVYSN